MSCATTKWVARIPVVGTGRSDLCIAPPGVDSPPRERSEVHQCGDYPSGLLFGEGLIKRTGRLSRKALDRVGELRGIAGSAGPAVFLVEVDERAGEPLAQPESGHGVRRHRRVRRCR